MRKKQTRIEIKVCRCGEELQQIGNLHAADQADIEAYLGPMRGLLTFGKKKPKHDIKTREGRVVADGTCQV